MKAKPFTVNSGLSELHTGSAQAAPQDRFLRIRRLRAASAGCRRDGRRSSRRPDKPSAATCCAPKDKILGYRVLENLNMSAMISLIAVPGVRPSRLRFRVIGASCAFETRRLKTILRTR